MMNGKAQISNQQLFALVAIYASMAQMLYLPGPLAKIADQDAWLAISVGLLIGFVPSGLALALLARYHPRRSFGQICEACFGRWVGKLATLITGSFSLLLASLATRNVIDFMAALLPGTPALVVSGLFVALAIYIAYNGAEVIARLAFLTLLLAIVVLVINTLGLIPEYDVLHIQPILSHGLSPVLRAAWPTVGWFGEIWLFGPLVGCLDNPRRTWRALLLGGAAAGLLLVPDLVATLLVFGPGLTKRLLLAPFAMTTMVRLGEFLERLEPLLEAIWWWGMAIKVTICIWTASVSFAEVVGLPNDRPVLLPVGVATVWLSLIWPSMMAIAVWGTTYWTPLTLTVSLGILVPLVLISWWRACKCPERSAAT